MDIRAQIVEHFEKVAQEQDKHLPSLQDDLPLLECGLDSLCFAIIVTRLEDEMGRDPFAADEILFPVTFGEFVRLYEVAVR